VAMPALRFLICLLAGTLLPPKREKRRIIMVWRNHWNPEVTPP
jgi:hypothetical protein